MKNEDRHHVFTDLEWLLNREGWDRTQGAWAISVPNLLGHPEWATLERTVAMQLALDAFPDILSPGNTPWSLSATREGWIEIARRTAGVDIVTEWLLQQE